ncbi:MAG: aminotransferase class III-fold pyridoxal phosphate-dependent enzyme, partial [Prolixibacteraceae bacterium]|nr:aminotransferase class III-fold pyridoxal phosphate-dependent enzyme [Burkholderiales bacterium]
MKSNIGHIIAAAGAAGVIKTALALESEILPASIHFDVPNPRIDFASSPFAVQSVLSSWPRTAVPRRAGVSSFGVGGTNAHVILEEAPSALPPRKAGGSHVLRLSARTPEALESATVLLINHLRENPTLDIGDVSFTLDAGRSRFPFRLAVAASNHAEAIDALFNKDHAYRCNRSLPDRLSRLGFIFPGQGAQYAGMGRELYRANAVFREAFDACLEGMAGHVEFDLRAILFDGSDESLSRTEYTQPATFCIEYALARYWQSRGLNPAVLIGHSVGEFVAAVVADVMSVEDAVRLVSRRGALMQALPAGSMLSVRMSAPEVKAILPDNLSLASENSPRLCVIAGSNEAVRKFAVELEAQGIPNRLLHTSHAFHSAMMDPAVAPFREMVESIALSPPAIPIVSTLTGKLLTASEATDAGYWARHLRETVRFSTAVRQSPGNVVFLEVGPRGTLSTLVRQHAMAGATAPLAIASLEDSPEAELRRLAFAEGQLWCAGFEFPSVRDRRMRVALPTYPFERKRHWLDAPPNLPSPTIQIVNPGTAAQTRSDEMPLTHLVSNTHVSRRVRLVDEIRRLFEDVAGVDLAAADSGASFIELGLDSLTLTQAAIQLKKNFSVKVTFRQLMESCRSLDKLAEHLDSVLPQEPATAPRDPAMTNQNPTPIVNSSPEAFMQQVIQQQMLLMAQQLALLGGAGGTQGVSTIPGVPGASSDNSASASLGQEAEPIKSVTYDVKKAFGAIARIHTQGNALTERQRTRLDQFIRRYAEKTAASKAFTAKHRTHLADPRVVNNFRPQTKEITYQIVVDKSRGAHVWDIDGNEYVDALNGFGMSLFGWQPPFVAEVIRKQLDAGYELGPMHPLAGDVARLVCE